MFAVTKTCCILQAAAQREGGLGSILLHPFGAANELFSFSLALSQLAFTSSSSASLIAKISLFLLLSLLMPELQESSASNPLLDNLENTLLLGLFPLCANFCCSLREDENVEKV